MKSPPDRSAQSEPNERTESSYDSVAHMHELYMPVPYGMAGFSAITEKL